MASGLSVRNWAAIAVLMTAAGALSVLGTLLYVGYRLKKLIGR